MKENISDYISYPILFSIGGPILMSIPFVGTFALVVLPIIVPLDILIPGNFTSTGEHVEYGFAWVTFKTTEAWLFHGAAFFLLGIIFASIKQVVQKHL